jgi:hypothetical protein
MSENQTQLWHGDMLSEYPMDSNAMVRDLDAKRLRLLLLYVEQATHCTEWPAIVEQISTRYPNYLRVKELFETLEAYTRIGQDIYEQWRHGGVRRIYDLCAGHGLLGLLFGNRFPRTSVVCVDIEKRPAFEYYRIVAQEHGLSLGNVTYLESDAACVDPGADTYVVCIHGCNEITRTVLARAAAAGAWFAAMPCCVRDGIYFRRIAHVDEQTRYAIAAGVIAGRFQARKITAIDPRITNRNLIILGKGAGSLDDG